MNIFKAIHNNIYFIGIYTYKYGRRVFSSLVRAVKKPLSFIAAIIYTAFKAFDMFFLKGLHIAADDYRTLRTDVKKACGNLRFCLKSPPTFFNILKGYIKTAIERHPISLSYLLSVTLPVAALSLLLVVTNILGGITFALKVQYDGNYIGYVDNESTLISAGEKAAGILNSGIETISTAEITRKSSYSLATIKKSELSGKDYIADCIIDSMKDSYINACAVYINNTMLCLVKSESDALYAFDKLLSDRKGANVNSTISFVEDIEFRECLYPIDKAEFLSANELYNTISAVKTSAKTYTVKKGDRESDILRLFNGDFDLLRQLNPNTNDITTPGTVIVTAPAINRLSTKLTFTNERIITEKFKTVELETDTLYSGDKQVAQKGVDGKTKVTELVTYVDGVLTSSTELKRTVVNETVNKIVKVGVKAKPKNHVGQYTIGVTKGRFIWPVVGLFTVYSWYGWRNLGWHSGIDISGSGASGALIVAAESGTVITSGWNDGGYGYYVIIEHSDGVRTLYGHCLSGSLMVKAGDKVSTGQAIARVGNTGYSFGAHLHFEVRVNGSPVNPAPYLGLS
ncbi:MAG TPA: peptidoglycan DD-metalloendopeptidase family protein [Oscillospiraceae bacterium]|nr:peptidoglycan DD-metalloendopeptidase family protein [Oscillospiraceae bacterium]